MKDKEYQELVTMSDEGQEIPRVGHTKGRMTRNIKSWTQRVTKETKKIKTQKTWVLRAPLLNELYISYSSQELQTSKNKILAYTILLSNIAPALTHTHMHARTHARTHTHTHTHAHTHIHSHAHTRTHTAIPRTCTSCLDPGMW